MASFIHDDLTLSDFIFHPTDAIPDASRFTLTDLSPTTTPLPFAIQHFAFIIDDLLALQIAPHKTHIFQPQSRCENQAISVKALTTDESEVLKKRWDWLAMLHSLGRWVEKQGL